MEAKQTKITYSLKCTGLFSKLIASKTKLIRKCVRNSI